MCSLIVQCTVILTFTNTHSGALEGEVVFPLPESAVVTSYSLEMDGQLVPASLVEAKTAEKIYEAEVKKGVDPGLLQKVAAGGNAFKTRVYPLPARGTRRLSLTYTQPLEPLGETHGCFTFSMAFGRAVDMSLQCQVTSEHPPQVESVSCPGCSVSEERAGRYGVSYVNQSHCGGDATLRVAVGMPSGSAPVIVVEKAGDGSGFYFAVSDVAPPAVPLVLAKHKVAIVWDVSLSRNEANIAEELRVLSLILRQDPSCVADVLVVRNAVEISENLNVEAVMGLLSTTPNDGATSLQELEGSLAPRLMLYDRILVFSDGQSTLGSGRCPCIEKGDVPPVYCIVSSARTNMSQLQHYWAGCSGGAVLRVGGQPAEGIAEATRMRSAKVLMVAGDAVNANPTRPLSTAGSSRFLITGRIPATSSPAASVLVPLGVDPSSFETRQYELRLCSASLGTMVQSLWAQQRIAELEVFPERNHDEILALGRKFNVVTASTSLLVLETLEQHLEHGVAPHPERTGLYQAFMKRVREAHVAEADRVCKKIETVKGYWRTRTDWHEREFSGPSFLEKGELESEGSQMRLAEHTLQTTILQTSMCCVCSAAACAPTRVSMECCVRRERCVPVPVGSMRSRSGGERGSTPPPCAANATVKYWSPDTPYLRAIAAAASPAEQYATYLKLRPEYAKTPAYYFDVGGHFLNPGRMTAESRELGLRILSNIAELGLDNSRILRVLGYKLYEAKEYALASEVFCRVALWRPTEPQSYRDLGLTLLERGWYQQALDLLWQTVTMEVPASFSEIEVEALWEIRDCLCRARRAKLS
eukprot:RCo025893